MVCRPFHTLSGSGIVCGPRPRRRACSVCHRPYGVRLCDWTAPSRRRPCSRALCVVCAVGMGPDVDWCPDHGVTCVVPCAGSPFLVLVSGSRRLVEVACAETFVRGELRALFAAGADLLVTGDAPGPDTWAAQEAAACGVSAFLYGLDGWIREATRQGPCRVRWSPHAPPTDPRHRKAWCLTRNAVMVAHVARKMRAGRRALVAGYVAATPGTAGTDHTLNAATRSALAVRRQVLDDVRLGPVREGVWLPPHFIPSQPLPGIAA